MRCRSELLALTLSSLFLLTGLTGCGGFNATPALPATSGNMQMEGTVFSGTQPVAGAQVRLYVAGSTGNASAATDLMGTGSNSPAAYTTTAEDGTFSLQGDFVCPAAVSSFVPQVYLVATGGNPGLAATVNNTSLVLVDVLGPCANLTSGTKTTINEITTVAAAWALSGFMTSATNVGATATNTAGLANAFLNAQVIADPAAGITPGPSIAAGNTIETGKVIALANVLATCSGSDGTTACQKLFTTSGLCSSTCTSDTLSAALHIIKHPSSNVAAVWALGNAKPVFSSGGLAAAPNEWTLSMTLTGGGINAPTELGLDAIGNVWVADYHGAITAYNPQGTPLSPANGFGYGTIVPEIYGLTVDKANNVWFALEERPSGIAALYGVTSGQTLGGFITINGSIAVTSNYIYFPESLATAQDGTILIGNYGDATITSFTYSPSAGFAYGLINAGVPYLSEPTDESGDASGGVWAANNGYYTVTHLDKSGNLISQSNCCNGPNGVATDNLGNAWVTNYYTNSVSEILPGCDSNASPNAPCYANKQNVVVFGTNSSCNPATASCGLTGGGLASPFHVIVDGAQNVWIANFHAIDTGYPCTLTELAGNANTLSPGTPISPSTVRDINGTVTSPGGYGLDANLLNPYDLAPDASGNLWVSNNGRNNMVMFFGLVAPTATPRLPIPVTP